MKQPSLFDPPGDAPSHDAPPDRHAREFSVDPVNDVVLEASAGTGKTRVLVDRYVRLIEAGVEPRNILAITFTRKAAAEMRERVLVELRRRVAGGTLPARRWQALMERVADIQISTIDAFCFSLLREFPLEADVDPAFDVADETEMARFAREAIDLTLRAIRGVMADDETVRLLLARVKAPVLAQAVAGLLDRRHVALPAIAGFVARQADAASAADVGVRFVRRLREVVDGSAHRQALVDDGPLDAPGFRWLAADLSGLAAFPASDAGRVQQLRRRLERYFLTKAGLPRQKITKPVLASHFPDPGARKRHEQALAALSPLVRSAIDELDGDVNALLARGLLRVAAMAAGQYERLLADNALMDFAAMLARSVALLERQEEFARSRLKLQARYHHVLVDEFQDTSRLQWRLIELLVAAWGEGETAADAPTSIFVVGDRKQSIYRFRHAEVTLLDEAARQITLLRPGRTVRQSIRTSFRAVPELLAFVNALAASVESDGSLAERFAYRDTDRFPVPAVAPGARRDGEPVLGLIASPSMADAAAAVADEVRRLLDTAVVGDRDGGSRPVRSDDIAVLFRARAGHQYFEDALEARGIRTYVYKGLGFFDAPEVQDLQALLRYLAAPESDLRAAELLRSRLIRLSDSSLARLAPRVADALGSGGAGRDEVLGEHDRLLLARARESVSRWRAWADRVPASELIDLILRESAYAFELSGRRLDQARENLKKVRALIRRVENRGYATLGRLARYFDTLRAGDESNAILEATGAVNLMTIHAAKGLEFPIVFLVNLHLAGRGRPAGFSVIEQGPDGQPEVAFNTSEATKLEDRRDEEELRRLLYVAVTRARDRLYLAGEVEPKEGRLKRAARSLSSLLPDSLSDLFAAGSASDASEAVWTADGSSFAFRICRATGELLSPDVSPVADPVEDVAVPLLHTTARRLSTATAGDAASSFADRPDGELQTASSGSGDDRLVGTLVHRLFQRRVDSGLDDGEIEAVASGMLGADERVDVADVAALVRASCRVYRVFRRRPDVIALIEGGECFYEVPFSCEPPERPGERVRGVVDCLVVGADGSATVLEFKTGEPRAWHNVQAGLYAGAMQSALGLARVDARVLYA